MSGSENEIELEEKVPDQIEVRPESVIEPERKAETDESGCVEDEQVESQESDEKNDEEEPRKEPEGTSEPSLHSVPIDVAPPRLMQTIINQIDVKHFGTEARAAKDAKHYLANATIRANMQSTSLSGAVNELIRANDVVTFDDVAPFLFASGQPVDDDTHNYVTNALQGSSEQLNGQMDIHASWVTLYANLPHVKKATVYIGRLATPQDWSDRIAHAGCVRFVVIVLAPLTTKSTKSPFEIARTISTIFSHANFAHDLSDVITSDAFHKSIEATTSELNEKQRQSDHIELEELPGVEDIPLYHIGRGLWGDIRRRVPFYCADFGDGLNNLKSVSKTISATVFLFFACLLPSVAFGSLNDNTTSGAITVQKTIIAQAAGGLIFALFSGQPLVILLTTAPLALYISIIQEFADGFADEGVTFLALYCAVGLMNAAFLLIYVFINLSKLMKFSTRSIEEIFGFFITCAFCKDALKHLADYFAVYYNDVNYVTITGTDPDDDNDPSGMVTNRSCTYNQNEVGSYVVSSRCDFTIESIDFHASRDKALLALVLTLGTAWLGLQIFNFRKSPFLKPFIRELISDYALAFAVIVFSLIGAIGFSEIELKSFKTVPLDQLQITLTDMSKLQGKHWGIAIGLGFCLSLLFFMDQNISAALVNTPANKLKKGAAYHLDLFVVALINIPLSLLGLPWIHGALPHSPLHAQALADKKETVEKGHVKEEIDFVRETRVTAVLSHIIIGLSLLATESVLKKIPKPVLDGLFLFLGLSGLYGNQLFERILLVFTEQAAYPPNHYVRYVPQRQIHMFTLCQFVQLIILAVIGFYPYKYLKLFFPIIILILMPIRHKIIPRIVPERYIHAMDIA